MHLLSEKLAILPCPCMWNVEMYPSFLFLFWEGRLRGAVTDHVLMGAPWSLSLSLTKKLKIRNKNNYRKNHIRCLRHKKGPYSFFVIVKGLQPIFIFVCLSVRRSRHSNKSEKLVKGLYCYRETTRAFLMHTTMKLIFLIIFSIK